MSAGKRQTRMHDAGPGFWTIDAIAHMFRMEFDMRAAARLPVRQGRCVGPVTRQGSGTAMVTCRQQEISGAARALDRSAHRMYPKRRAMPANRQVACRPGRSRVSIRDGEEVAVCVLHVRERLTVRSGCLARCAHADGWKRIILPVFGDWRVDAVTAKDVRNWFDDLSVTRAASANRTLTVLSSMMKHAEALSSATIRMRVPSWR